MYICIHTRTHTHKNTYISCKYIYVLHANTPSRYAMSRPKKKLTRPWGPEAFRSLKTPAMARLDLWIPVCVCVCACAYVYEYVCVCACPADDGGRTHSIARLMHMCDMTRVHVWHELPSTRVCCIYIHTHKHLSHTHTHTHAHTHAHIYARTYAHTHNLTIPLYTHTHTPTYTHTHFLLTQNEECHTWRSYLASQ